MSAVMLVIFAPLGAVLAGLALGKPGVRQQAIYWAVVCSALGAISVVPVRLDLLTFVFWPMAGAVAGAYCGARLSKVSFSFRTGVAAVIIGWLIYMPLRVPFGMGDNEFAFDLAIAPIICVGLSGLIHLIEWLRVQYGTPREIWAAGLVFAVIAGHLAAAAMNSGRFQ
jgi:hypothetical protein